MRIESLKLLCYSVKSPSSDGLATQLIAFFPNFTSSSSLIETLPANDDSLPLIIILPGLMLELISLKRLLFWS